MSKTLKVLVVPNNTLGSVKVCLGTALVMSTRGHTVVFAVQQQWKDSTESDGFQVVVLNTEDNTDILEVSENGYLFNSTPLEKALTRAKSLQSRIDYYIKLDEELERVLNTTRPDVILIDHMFTVPCVEMSNIPWVWHWTRGPLYLYGNDEDVPPAESGNLTHHQC